MPFKVNIKQQLERAKLRLNAPQQNPFDRTRSNVRHNVIGKPKKNQRRMPEAAPAPKFDAIQDERPDFSTGQTQARLQLSKALKEKIPEEQKLEENKHKATQEIYMEIIQKSKAAKKERQSLKAELDATIKKMDQQYGGVKAYLPQREDKTDQIRQQFQVQIEQMGGDVKRANATSNTREEAVRIGAEKLQKLQKQEKPLPKPNQAKPAPTNEILGDDDGEQFILEPVFGEDAEEFEEEETAQLPDLANEEQLEQFSLALTQIPFIIAVPDTFAEFQSLLQSVEPCEEIVVLDRLVKSNSTLVDGSNQKAIETLINYLLKRLLNSDDVDPRRVDAQTRCIRHCTSEMPEFAAGQFNGYLQKFTAEFAGFYREHSYFGGVSVQFLLLLRALQIAFLLPTPGHQLVQNFFLTCEQLVFKSALASEADCGRFLLLLQIIACECVQTDTVSGALFFGFARLISAMKKIGIGRQSGRIQFQALVNGGDFGGLHQIVENLIIASYRVLKPAFEGLPPLVAQIVAEDMGDITCVRQQQQLSIFENQLQVFYVYDSELVKEHPFAITEKEPLYMKNFNPKKTGLLDVDRQRQVIDEKREKKRNKDEFRRQVKEIQKKNLIRQNEQIAKTLKVQKAKTHRMEDWAKERREK